MASSFPQTDRPDAVEQVSYDCKSFRSIRPFLPQLIASQRDGVVGVEVQGQLVRVREQEEHDSRADRTGQVLWPAAILLARWMAQLYGSRAHPPRRLVGVELGCGLGFTGISCAQLLADRFAEVYVTDLDASCARENVGLQREPAAVEDGGAVETEAGSEACSGGCELHALDLPWGPEALDAEAAALDGRADVVFASDVIYNQDTEVLQMLAETIDRLLRRETDADLTNAEAGPAAAEAQEVVSDVAAEPSLEVAADLITRPHALIAFEMRNNWFSQAEFHEICEGLGYEIDSTKITPKGHQGEDYYIWILTRKREQ